MEEIGGRIKQKKIINLAYSLKNSLLLLNTLLFIQAIELATKIFF